MSGPWILCTTSVNSYHMPQNRGIVNRRKADSVQREKENGTLILIISYRSRLINKSGRNPLLHSVTIGSRGCTTHTYTHTLCRMHTHVTTSKVFNSTYTFGDRVADWAKEMMELAFQNYWRESIYDQVLVLTTSSLFAQFSQQLIKTMETQFA
jgi:hypothetical protein